MDESCYCAASIRPPCGWCSDPDRTAAEFEAGRTLYDEDLEPEPEDRP